MSNGTIIGEKRIGKASTWIVWIINILVLCGFIYGVMSTTLRRTAEEVNSLKVKTHKNTISITELKTDIKWIKEGIDRIEIKVSK